MTASHRVVLSVGSNLGDRLGTLQGCVQAIGDLPETDVLAVSPVYETAPVGGPAQPDYLNAVLVIETGLAPRDLLAATQRIEADFGRARPRAHERAFVLAPWHDLDPAASLPGRGAVAALLADALLTGSGRDGVRRQPGMILGAPDLEAP